MNILLTGGTGLVGSALIPLLLAKQHQLCVLTRQIQPLHFPKGVKKINNLAEFQQLNDFDAVINLAGEPIFDHRWTAKQKAELFTSRVNLTQNLTALINRSDNPPHTFISGSASGYYGDHQDHWISENSPAGTAFPSQLCQQWEAAAQQANTRVCLLRTGMVFSLNGGAFPKMLALYRFGLGGKLGSGKQYWAWISLQDMISGILFLLENPQCKGTFNFSAPQPITNQDFNLQLGEHLNRPHFANVPAFLLRIFLGERTQLLLNSQRILPKKLRDAGFQFNISNFQDFLTVELKNKNR
ncbi:TIGR01777 family oxidoreductase [Avibacterium paragallinarum]|uniref:TIGR01777 family oxidoreductase n=1 Tax=Avibacterium paragallinarum TaxID=728 RepID=A0AAE5TM36_AVIPA|nr:TIGR01777 family oxidoreductase [Avibacterium paragallinarum]MEE3609020.1 TIGR01777 family oxidoreductase [Avibacterium paragallinarum]MEE3621239.1 TIGR01777 family oxidoreductase [Avibacterium paragallinarum]MEE3668537.1 TIGR01777 family oxidoreductase [Avibacterium paragallinarum]MEE3681226.1 TIGR01777 family oxidoreductase [Avibacterium paragallinarum]MEE4386196.1 TIGR01777 family oxidoreductase [Avibacterium paragallinarum]